MNRQLGRAFTASWKNVRKCNTSAKESLDTQPLPKLFQMENLTEKQKAKRREFIEAEKIWDAQVQWESLSPDEAHIVKLHKQAVNNGHFSYDDPKLQRKVLTRLRHFLKGKCCGNACRHCIYNYERVPEDLKGVKIFNSAFWVEKNPQ